MKKQDIFFIIGIIIFFLPFFLITEVYEFYKEFNKENGLIMSFIKFAFLATLGEVIGLRIKTGQYFKKGFGIIPRAIIWGFIGISIKVAFIIFVAGTPIFLEYVGLENATEAIKGDFTWKKLLTSFSISFALNVVYAPIMMTFHKITDTHIVNNGGTLKVLITPIKFRKIFENLNWDVQWNFIFKKTIPFFWIPAHTITFLLPEEFQILFAALLGIVLGIILSIASIKK